MIVIFYLLILSLPLTQHHLLGERVGTVTVEKVIGAVCLLAAIAYMGSGTRKNLLGVTGIACLVYFVTAIASVLSVNGISLASVLLENNVLSILLLLFVTAVFVDSLQKLHMVLLVLIGSAAIASIYAIREWMSWGHFILGYRPGGISGDANYFGICAALALPIVFSLLPESHNKRERTYLFACGFTILIGFMLAASRGAFVALAAGGACLLIWSRRPVKATLLFIVVIVPFLVFSPNSPLDRLLNPDYGDKLAVDAREIAWRAGLRMFVAHPLTGVGVSRFKPEMVRYQDKSSSLDVNSVAHNTYLEVAAEQGIVGFIPFISSLLVAVAGLRRCAHIGKTLGSPLMARACIGLQASVVTAWVGAFFLSAWWFRPVWFPVFVGAAIEPLATAMVRRKMYLTRLRRQRDDQRQAYSGSYAGVQCG